MSIEDIWGQPHDKESYQGYRDIPVDINKSYMFPPEVEDGNQSYQQGSFYDQREICNSEILVPEKTKLPSWLKPTAFAFLGLLVIAGVMKK